MSEALVFNAIEEQRRIVERARSQARTARRKAPGAVEVKPSNVWTPRTVEKLSTAADYSRTVEPFPAELW